MKIAFPNMTRKSQHGIGYCGSDFTVGLQHKNNFLNVLQEIADIVHFVVGQSHDGGHMFPRQQRNAPAGLLPPLWSHEDPFIEFIAAWWEDILLSGE